MMTESEFEKLLKKYLDGTISSREEKTIERWYSTLGQNSLKPLSAREKAALRKVYWNQFRNTNFSYRGKTRRLIPFVSAIAASIALIVVSLAVIKPFKTIPDLEFSSHESSQKEFSNGETMRRFITLSDGSVVILQPGSSIRVSESFNHTKREVTLTGEAYFEIAHNPKKPFYVITNEVVTKVLGTSFIVKALTRDDKVTVSVKTGIVSVFAQATEQEINEGKYDAILVENEQAIYSRASHEISKGKATESQQIVSDYEIQTEFVDEPIVSVFESLEKMYGFKIVVDHTLFSNCKLTTTLTGNNLQERLKVICEAIGATYTVDDTMVFIKGDGCH